MMTIFLVILISLSWCPRGLASDINKADQLFEKGTFQQALEIYDAVYKEASDAELKNKAFFRSCESLGHLFRYGDAAQKILSNPLPLDPEYHARFLMLKAEMLRNFLMQYASVQRGDVMDDEKGVDVFRLTPEEIRAKIKGAYLELWNMRKALLKMDLLKEGYFFDIKDVDPGTFPDFFDYLIASWTNFLLETEAPLITEKTVRPVAEIFLTENFEHAVSPEDPAALLAAELMEEASRSEQKGRLEAAERWKIERLLLPSRYGNAFDLKALADDKNIYDYKDSQAYLARAQEILLRWMKDLKTQGAKSEAGYVSAVIFNGSGKLAEAVRLCEQVEKDFPGTYAARRAEALRSGIQMPQLSFVTKAVMPPAKDALTLNTKNVKEVYFRVYRVSPEEIKKENADFQKKAYGKTYENPQGWSQLFSQSFSYQDWGKKWIDLYLTQKQPHEKWIASTGDKGDFQYLSKILTPPDLEPGIYLVIACADKSFNIGSDLMSAGFLNVTDILLMGTAGFTSGTETAYFNYLDKNGSAEVKDEGYRFYVLSAKTGKPVDRADLNVFTYVSSQSTRPTFNLKTNGEGYAGLTLPLNVAPHSSSNYYQADPLAQSGDSYSFWRNSQYLNYSPDCPIKVFIETDRPIYRPGDKVQAKVIAVRKTPQGYKTVGDKRTASVSVQDPNGKDFFKKTVELSDFGSASLEFEIPQGRLLGVYSLNAECDGGSRLGSHHGGISFSVEEYKRPEFEIVMDPAKEAWKYQEPVTIKGKAKYYFGGPVPDAPVKYHIKRQPYVPYCFRYWFGQNYYANAEEIASGDLKTDAEGILTLTFTPTPPPQAYAGNIPDMAEFIVEVEGRDAGGRTISTQATYRAGRSAFYFVIEPSKGFYGERESIEVDAKQLTLNDAPIGGASDFTVFGLADISKETLQQIARSYAQYNIEWMPALDVQLKDVANGKQAAQGKAEFDKEGKGTLKIGSLPQGVYRIVLKSRDPWGSEVEQKKIIVVTKNDKEAVPVKAAFVMLPEKDEYKVGDTARFLIGSALVSGTYQVELWAGDYFLEHLLVEGDQPIRLIEIPVTEKMKGGFALRWFGAQGFDIYYSQATVSVPWKEKVLTVNVEPFSKELKPGEEVTWGIKLADFQGKPQEGEVLALMYDRSLEYYVKSANPWLDDLYAQRKSPDEWSYALFEQYAANLPITEGLLEKLMKAFNQPPKEPKIPGLRTGNSWVRLDKEVAFDRSSGLVRSELSSLEANDKRSVPARKVMAPGSATVSGFMTATGVGGERKDDRLKASNAVGLYAEAAQAVEARKEFADTAMFKPHVMTGKDGKASFSFKAPEQLTSWKVKAFAFTKDVSEGTVSEEAVTRKDLMVRADLPRFFREKDKGMINAIVHNESDNPLEGELFIDVTENKGNINQKLKLTDNKKTFTVAPHSLSSFGWMLEIPEGVTTYKVRVVAVAGKLTDAEERDLPILPSRQRLIESAFVSLSGSGSKKLEIPLKADPTRINESMAIQVDPQLALSILNTMPFLVQYPHECVEQILNKYVPLSIMNEVYKKYPEIRTAVSKIPDRQTPTPAWEKNDPRRLTTLMETPWVWESEGRPTIFPIIDLLDSKIVTAQAESNFQKLQSAQLANGGFPWWPGGAPDPYITLYVLSGFSEARRYGVSVDQDMIQKALSYVNAEIPLRLKPEERDLAVVSFAAYVVTSFSPKEFSEAQKGHDAAKAWTVFLEQHVNAMTPLGKAHLAFTYLNLGDKKKANKLLDMAMDGVREDPIAGVYWAPEKYSWVWYSDTVEKHAFFLRILQQLRPDDPKIPGMVQWLLFNRKGNVWKSTKASVAAVYALLDYLNQRGALASDESFNVKWGKNIRATVVKADDWLNEPIRWEEKGPDIMPGDNQALITKEGPGLAFASMTWTYSTDQLPEASTAGMLEIQRTFYRRVKEGDAYHLKPLGSGEKVVVGDQIEVQLKINTRSQFEYMYLKDLKAAGFEAETLLSGWKYDPLSFYEEPRDSLTNFFISWIPHGEFILRYRLRPSKPGVYRIGAATLQSMYAPEMTAHSTGFIIEVVEK